RSVEAQFAKGEIMVRNAFGRVRFVYERNAHEFAKRACHFLGCSTAAEVINQRAIEVWEQLGLLPILIVHDELVYETPKGAEGDVLRRRIHDILVQPIKEMDGFVIPFTCKVGPNYGNLTEIELERKAAA